MVVGARDAHGHELTGSGLCSVNVGASPHVSRMLYVERLGPCVGVQANKHKCTMLVCVMLVGTKEAGRLVASRSPDLKP